MQWQSNGDPYFVIEKIQIPTSLSITYVRKIKIGAEESNIILLYLFMNRTKGSIKSIRRIFLISWCKLSTSARKGIIFSFWLLIMKATGFDFVCHIKQSHTRSYINNITFFVAWIHSYDKWNAPSCALCALHSHLSSRLHLFMTFNLWQQQ